MLKLLNIGNLAVMDRLCIEFQRGLNLLTGETGSGKSIIVDALGILFGERFSPEKVRSGEKRAWVEGVFEIPGRESLSETLDRMGMEMESNELILKREWTAGGRVRSFINDSLAGSSALKELRNQLVEIHGQGEEQALLSPASHLELLDRFADLTGLRDEVSSLAHRHVELSQELRQLLANESERLRTMDLLKFQVNEIDRAAVQVGEDGALVAERRLLSQAEKATRLAAESYGMLYEQDDAVYNQLASITRRLAALAEIDGGFSLAVEQLGRAGAALQEVAAQLRDFGAGRDFSAGRLAEVEGRLLEVDRLKRKYGPDLQDVLAERERMGTELVRLEGSDERIEEITKEMAAAEKAYRRLAERLSKERRAAVTRLESSIRKELDQLAMRGTRFEVRLTPSASEVSARGLEEIEFLIAPNIGENLRPLARVASGGELSRIMLALRSVITQGEPKSIVFDEIDTGIGGRAAEEVGARLKRLAAAHQVFCVTHQPQIARFADAHYRVRKVVHDGRTRVVVEALDQEGRVQELSRMLAGAEVTATARRHAKELIKAH